MRRPNLPKLHLFYYYDNDIRYKILTNHQTKVKLQNQKFDDLLINE